MLEKLHTHPSTAHISRSRRRINIDISCHTGCLPPEVHLNKPAHTLHQQMQPPVLATHAMCTETCRPPLLRPPLAHTHTHKKHTVAQFKQRAFVTTAGSVTQNNICVFSLTSFIMQCGYHLGISHRVEKRLDCSFPCHFHAVNKQLLFAWGNMVFFGFFWRICGRKSILDNDLLSSDASYQHLSFILRAACAEISIRVGAKGTQHIEPTWANGIQAYFFKQSKEP